MRYTIGVGVLLAVVCLGNGSNTARAVTVQWSLAITDVNDQPIASPLAVGQIFWLDVGVDDLRAISDAGVLEGITDILFDQTKVAPTGNVLAGPDYPLPTAAPHFSLPAANDIRVNGTVPINISGTPVFDPPGSGPLLLDRVEFQVIAPGTINFDTAMLFGEGVFVDDGTGNPIGLPAAEIGQASISTQAVPEPATILLALLAFASLVIRRVASFRRR